jgi:hypothetical protein
MAQDYVAKLENRIAALETRVIGLPGRLGAPSAFSEGSCTNNCTAACTIGCTSGCTGGCIAEPVGLAPEQGQPIEGRPGLVASHERLSRRQG